MHSMPAATATTTCAIVNHRIMRLPHSGMFMTLFTSSPRRSTIPTSMPDRIDRRPPGCACETHRRAARGAFRGAGRGLPRPRHETRRAPPSRLCRECAAARRRARRRMRRRRRRTARCASGGAPSGARRRRARARGRGRERGCTCRSCSRPRRRGRGIVIPCRLGRAPVDTRRSPRTSNRETVTVARRARPPRPRAPGRRPVGRRP